MKHQWDADEIIQHLTLLPEEARFVGINAPNNQLGKALLLKFFQYEGRFPESKSELPREIIDYVRQLGLPVKVINEHQWDGRTIKEHRRQIRELLGFHPATLTDQSELRTWLIQEVLPQEYQPVYLTQLAYQHLKVLHIEPPTQGRTDRLVMSAIREYEQTFFETTAARLSEETKGKLRELVYKKEEHTTQAESDEGIDYTPDRYLIHELKSGPGGAKVTNLKKVADRLKLLQVVGLPDDLFLDIPLRFLRQYRQQVAVESISHLQRRHENPQSYTLLAAFCWVRQREITDQLVELFIQVLNTTRLRAEQHIKRELLGEYIRVDGKQGLLYRLAEAMCDHPDGIIREILYPLVGEKRLHSLVEEAKNRGTYHQSIQTRVSASYTHHYRQMVPLLLEVLTFQSNNERHKPLIEALDVVTDYLEEQDAFYPIDQEVPMDDVIQKQWQSWIYQTDPSGKRRIRRVRYELCVLQSLRDKLRCKEIWVEGADRYRNPDEDVPADFGDKRQAYYESLTLPLSADGFVQQIKSQLEQGLPVTDHGNLYLIAHMPCNDKTLKKFTEIGKKSHGARQGMPWPSVITDK